MWLLTPEGFFSAVVDDKNSDVLQIRTRSKQDALNLATWLVANNMVAFDETYPDTPSLVLEWKGRDYPYRVLVWREQWAAYVAAQVDAITYRNFKNEVKKRQGDRRASIYGRIWSVLLDVSREHLPQPKPQARPSYYAGSLFSELHDEFPSLADRLAHEVHPIAPGDSDARCPRCDKFLSDVGVDSDGECRKCKAVLDDAIEAEDWEAVQQISVELDLL